MDSHNSTGEWHDACDDYQPKRVAPKGTGKSSPFKTSASMWRAYGTQSQVVLAA